MVRNFFLSLAVLASFILPVAAQATGTQSEQFAAAKALFAAREYKQALEAYRQITVQFPQAKNAHFNCGLCLFNLKDYNNALTPLQDELKIQPTYARAQVLIGQCYLEMKNYPLAERELQKATTTDSTGMAEMQLGRCMYAERKLDDAITHYRKSLAISPDANFTNYNLGLALFDQKKFSEAAPCFAKEHQIQPSHASCCLYEARCSYEQKNYSDAIKWIQAALSLDPNVKYGNYYYGKCYLARGDNDNAEKQYRAELEHNPNDPYAQFDLGLTLLRKHQNEESAILFRDVLHQDPKHKNANVNLGIVLERMEKFDEAEKALRAELALQPNSLVATKELSYVLEQLGDLKESLAVAQSFVTRFPNDPSCETMRRLIKSRQKEVERRQLVESDKAIPVRSSDYLAYVNHESTSRWSRDKFPLKIYINEADAAKLPNFRTQYVDVLRQSFTDWHNATNGVVSFNLISDPQGADIVCRFSLDPLSLENAEGVTKALPCHECMQTALITLRTVDVFSNESVSDKRMHSVCLHEIGHSLGFEGHSPNPHDVMYYCSSESHCPDKLSTRDVTTMNLLYGKSLADGWVNPTSKEALDRKASCLLREKNYSEALNYIRQALCLDNNFESAKRRLVYALNGVGWQAMNAGDYATAERSFIEAMNYKSFAPDEINKIVVGNYAIVLRRTNRAADADRFGRVPPGN